MFAVFVLFHVPRKPGPTRSVQSLSAASPKRVRPAFKCGLSMDPGRVFVHRVCQLAVGSYGVYY